MSDADQEPSDLSSSSAGQGAAFVPVQVYNNYIDAHIIKGRMEEEGISCWLKDENTVTLNPIWTQAVGGIKLMVAFPQAERARDILREVRKLQGSLNRCPQCGSENVELVSTPRKAANWLAVLLGGLFFNYAMPPHKINHCFDCGNESASPLHPGGGS